MPANGAAFLGEISMYGFNFSPVESVSCNGALIAISQNGALFSLLGTFFGGDGRVNFGVPNMNSRSPAGRYAGGSTLGLSQYAMGQLAGVQYASLSAANLPAHTHTATFTAASVPANTTVEAYVSSADKTTPVAGDLIAGSGDSRFRAPGGFGEPAKVPLGGVTVTGGGAGGAVTVGSTGSNVQFHVQSPVQAVNFSICSNGLYPPRN